jgi:hypothetical protein
MTVKLSPSSPYFVRPVTIPELARRIGVPRRTMFRRVIKMHAADRALDAAEADPAKRTRALWLYRPPQGAWSVNEARMRASHPEAFGTSSNDELQEQHTELRDEFLAHKKDSSRRLNALAAAFREHGQKHRKRQSEPPP